MWNNLVLNSDTTLRHLQGGFSEAVATHPMMMVGGVAAALAMIGTHWLAVIEAELREFRTRQIVREWPVRPIR